MGKYQGRGPSRTASFPQKSGGTVWCDCDPCTKAYEGTTKNDPQPTFPYDIALIKTEEPFWINNVCTLVALQFYFNTAKVSPFYYHYSICKN